MISELWVELSSGLCMSEVSQLVLSFPKTLTRKDDSRPRAGSLQIDSPIFDSKRFESVISGPT